ncbi:MAG TPA: universal stress protein, partial [Coleofasciculaceae cyanobacterium]
MDRNDLIEQMVLLPEPASAASKWSKSTKSVNLVVGYNASPNSQTALDLTMWIAHQTRLATQKQVTVQVVYVIPENCNRKGTERFNSGDLYRSSAPQIPSRLSSKTSTLSVATLGKSPALAVASKKELEKQRRSKKTDFYQSDFFEKADSILWQARCLAEEWRGSFKAHLRFGEIAAELRDVVETEAATLLLLGCNSVEHTIVQNLGSNFPCAVLGIPRELSLHGQSPLV